MALRDNSLFRAKMLAMYCEFMSRVNLKSVTQSLSGRNLESTV